MQVVQWGLFLCLLFMVTGCQGVDVSASSPTEPAGQMGEVPYDYDAMREDAVIQLREEPRLQSPTRTVVGEGPQAYTLFFREAMDRNSVEAAIRLHAKETADQQGYVEPDWDFYWVNDRQLQLVANLDTSPVPGQGGIEYLIHVAGAKTLEGRELPEQTPAFGAVWFAPQQLWKISMDGQVRQQLTDFPVLFGMTLIDPDSRYLLLSRYQEYCECDIRYPKLYGVYVFTENKVLDCRSFV